jgi:hypothetical protein
MSWEEMSREEMSWDEVSWDEMSRDEISWTKCLGIKVLRRNVLADECIGRIRTSPGRRRTIRYGVGTTVQIAGVGGTRWEDDEDD